MIPSGLLYMTYPDGCQRKVKAHTCEEALALDDLFTMLTCINSGHNYYQHKYTDDISKNDYK